MMISRESFVKPTSGEPSVSREVEQIVRFTRNRELVNSLPGELKGVLDLAERTGGVGRGSRRSAARQTLLRHFRTGP